MRSITISVPSPAQPARLDLFLAANVHGVSRGRIKTLIKNGCARVNGVEVVRPGIALQAGDEVRLTFAADVVERPDRLPKTALLSQGEGWWVVNKPPLVPGEASQEDGLGVAGRARKLTGGASNLTALGTLDTLTSGPVWLGSPEAAASAKVKLARAVAVVCPPPSEDSGEVPHSPWLFSVTRRGAGGLRAELALTPRDPASPVLGTLRQSLAGAGWPVVGDLSFGVALPGGAPRLALHVTELTWTDTEGQPSSAVADVPEDEAWSQLLDGVSGTPSPVGAPAKSSRKKHGKKKRIEPPTPTTSGTTRDKAITDTAKVVDRYGWDPLDAKRGWAPQGGEVDELAEPSKRVRRPLRISQASADIIAAGHPWVLPDRQTGPRHTLKVGETIDLVDGEDHFVAVAIADPDARICARVLLGCDADTGPIGMVEWRERADEAIGRRDDLLDEPGTDAIRLIHGHADGLPGLWVDLWGSCIVATRLAKCVDAFTDAVYSAVAERFPTKPIYEKDHLTDLRAADKGGDRSLPGRWIKPPPPGHPASSGVWSIQELGASFEVQPTGDLTTGFYPDQRDNRRWLNSWTANRGNVVAANLFAHTGAFSVSLALAGASRVFTVDLSPAYLDWYRRNLVLNGLSVEDHPAVAGDSLAWLEGAPPLDVVVLDPPSFAKARGKRGGSWNAQRDYADLVAAAARVLKPRGVLLCCHNLRGAKNGWLRSQVDKGLWKADRTLSKAETLVPAPDFPVTHGFPEGRTFRGLMVTVR